VGGTPFDSALSCAVTPLEIQADDDALTEVSDVVSAGGIVLLGETHGVVENAAVLDWFVRHLGPAQLGLELNPPVGAALCAFAKGRPIEVSEVRPSRDGRITPQLFCAVRGLVQRGLVRGIAAFVPDDCDFSADPSQNAWERALATRLLSLRNDGAPMIVTTGSVHALVEPQPVRGLGATPIGRRFATDPAFEHRDSFYPMGWHLAQVAMTVSVHLRYGRGTYSNFGVKHFADDPAVKDNRLRFRGQELTVEVLDATAAPVPDDG
jgi:hypothetical protein